MWYCQPYAYKHVGKFFGVDSGLTLKNSIKSNLFLMVVELQKNTILFLVCVATPLIFILQEKDDISCKDETEDGEQKMVSTIVPSMPKNLSILFYMNSFFC